MTKKESNARLVVYENIAGIASGWVHSVYAGIASEYIVVVGKGSVRCGR